MLDRQGRSNARLDDCISLNYTPVAGAEPWPIERMRHRANQTGGSTSRQACVCVKRDHIANTSKVCSREAAHIHKSCARRTAQELVQFMKLSALALPAHPLTVA